MKALRLFAVMLLCLVFGLDAQTPADVISPDPPQYVSPRISLLTARAGSEIYQLEGHSALRLLYPEGQDFVVNWGVFDFAAPHFVYRFVKGETDYMIGVSPTSRFLDSYRREGRKVYEQVLDLSPEECEKVEVLIRENLLPENISYRYNYIADNCATRPLAIIEKAIGDTLALSHSALPEDAEKSFRNAMRHYHENYPWYQFGIDLALGSVLDKQIDERALTFSPEALEQMMTGARRTDGRPLVKETNLLVDSPHKSVVLGPTPFVLSPMFWSLIVLVIAIAVSVNQLLKHRLTLACKLFDSFYFTIAGVCGLILTFLIFISIHDAASPNWIYLWLNPACFAGVILVWSKRSKKLLKSYQFCNFALLIALAIALCFGAQSPNPAFIPLMAADGVRALSCIVSFRRS